MKKTLITSIFSNPQFNHNNARGIETIYLKQMLEDNNHKVFILGKKCRTNNNIEFYLDRTVDISDITNIFIQLSPANFFGGVFDQYTIDIIEKLAKANVKFYIMPTDPRIKPVNPAQIMFNRFGLCEDYIESWNKILIEAIYLFPGKDLNKFFGTDTNFKNIKELDWFKYIFSKDVNFAKTFNDKKEYDIVYYGDKRGSYRENRIRHFLSNKSCNLLVGYKTDKVEADFIKKIKHSLLQDTINRAIVSLVIADKEHENNVVTFRFYEALASNALAAIDLRFDPDKKLIKNKILRNLLYVQDSRDIVKLVNSYSEDLIKLQHKELKRIFNEGIYKI